jgi:hypothetical protein
VSGPTVPIALRLLPPALTSAGLVGGYGAARATGNRPLGGAVLTAVGAGAFAAARAAGGPGRAAVVTAVYLAAFGLSHPLAKRLGAWPSVFTVTAATAALAVLVPALPRGRR